MRLISPRMRLNDFSVPRVRQPDMLMLDCVAGSHAYGTAVAGSDEDRRGVFAAPRRFLLGLDTIEQVSDERHDEVYYEVGRFISLLLKNAPNVLELLAMPEDCVLKRHPAMDLLKPEIFLSKLCAKTFGEYAMGQIRKARGLNKKVVNPQPDERYGALHFCHVPEGQGSAPVERWLAERGLTPRDCSLTAVRGIPGFFAMYPACGENERGILSPKDPDALLVCSVPPDAAPIGWMHFNQDAFKAHCKAHREYHDWVRLRNPERHAANARADRGYDVKNLMHTLRLLDTAADIAREGKLIVRRPNRDFLLRVRAGEFSYEELVDRAEARHAEVTAAFAHSPLRELPDESAARDALDGIRVIMARHARSHRTRGAFLG